MFYPNKYMTIEEYITQVWLPRKKDELKVNTITRYEILSVRIIEHLGHIPLSKVTQPEIYDFYEELHRAKSLRSSFRPTALCMDLVKLKKCPVKDYILHSIRHGMNISSASAELVSRAYNFPVNVLFNENVCRLSDRTISHYHKLLYSIFKEALYDGIIEENVMNKIRPPKIINAREARSLDIESSTEIIKQLKQFGVSPFREVLLLIFYTGMRRGEACGLQWNDIDFENRTITIRRASYYLPKKGIYTDSLKTPNSHRIISFDKKVLEILSEIIIYQREICNYRENLIDTEQRLFTYDDRSILNPNSVTKYYHKFIAEHELSDSTVHTLRHTNASIMIAAQTPITTVSGRLGHANSAITLRYYAHQISGENEKAAKAIENLI